ncbi:MAG: hypothetical protein HY610_00660, partial [Elusimicrobia bacterium]|nr:hypothetical protein [Elusimicrobiota bacterium]
DDGFGNITKAVIAQTYDSKLIERFGKALLVESKTHTDNARFEDSNMDGSSQIQDVTVTYTYDSRGRLEKAAGGGTVTSDDGFGNLSSGNITQTYFILRGQAKLASSLTESDAVNLDGSISHQEMTLFYFYEANGKLSAAKGIGTSQSNDGFENINNSNIIQEYKILNGQAKLSKSVTSSVTLNSDGSKSWMGEEGKGQAMEVSYRYYGEEGFAVDRSRKRYQGAVAESLGRGASFSDDGFGNITYSLITQGFMILNGQAKMVKSVTASKTENLDGSKSWMGLEGKGQAMEVNYRYYGEDGFPTDKSQRRFLGTVAKASGNGQSLSDDGFGNLTNSSIMQDFKILNGQAKLSRSMTASKTENVDGSKSWMGLEGKGEAMVVDYEYYGEQGLSPEGTFKRYLGTVARAAGRGKAISDDGFNNITTSETSQEFGIINGQARISKSSTASKTENVDGSKSWMGLEGKGRAMEVSYRYYGEEGIPENAGRKKFLGSVAMANGGGSSIADDGFGNITRSNITQEFEIVNGQAKISKSLNSSTTENLDGSFSAMGWMNGDGMAQGKAMTVNYLYDRVGRLTGAFGSGESASDDGFGNRTTSAIAQTYAIIAGQAKIASVKTRADIRNIDGSHSLSSSLSPLGRGEGEGSVDSVVSYFYDAQGILLRAENTVPGVTVMDDGFGNRTSSQSTQVYEILNGQAKVKTVTSHT